MADVSNIGSPIAKVPEELISEIISYLDMRERARFASTNRRHTQIEARTGHQRYNLVELTAAQDLCECRLTYNPPRITEVLTKPDAGNFNRFWETMASMLSKTTVQTLQVTIDIREERMMTHLNEIISTVYCKSFVFHLKDYTKTAQTSDISFPDLTQIWKPDESSVALHCSPQSCEFQRLDDFILGLPRLKSFIVDKSLRFQDERPVEDACIARMIKQCRITNIRQHGRSATTLVNAFKSVIDSETGTQITVWSGNIETWTDFIRQMKISFDDFEEIPDKWHVHRASCTVALCNGSGAFGVDSGVFYLRTPSERQFFNDYNFMRMLIAKVPEDMVEDTEFMHDLWKANATIWHTYQKESIKFRDRDVVQQPHRIVPV